MTMDNAALDQRIAQWEKMTHEAPDGMAWFSLGNAYKDADRYEDAARALRKCLEMDDGMSRAYQLLGQVLIKVGADDQAADVLTRGYTIAATRRDVMPQRAMQSLLEKMGKPIPQVALPQPPGPGTSVPVNSANQVLDRRTGQLGPRLPDPPFRGPLGLFIFDHYSATTFRQWISQGTKVINELRLDFSREDHQRTYDIHMMEWLGFTMEEADEYAKQNKR